MQAPLSLQQRAAIQSTYTTLTGTIAFLEEMQGRFAGDARLTCDNLCDLARMNRHKLVEAFPDLLEWMNGGVS